MKMETIEGNKLIAYFVGYYIDHSDLPKRFQDLYSKIESGPMPRYNESWDWLMPVLHKINNIFAKISPIQDELTPHIIHEEIEQELLWIDIEKVWIKVVDFIQWYNQQSK